LLALVVASALLVWFFLDPQFYIYEIEVGGNTWVSADEVYRASGLHCVSIFYVDRAQVAESICQEVPGVIQASVSCGWPSRVHIGIRERKASFVWRTGRVAFVVDRAGHVLEPDDGSHEGLLSVRDLDEQPLEPGDRVNRTALDTASRLHSLLPDVGVFDYSGARGVSFVDRRGWRIFFGDGQGLAEKVASMHVLVDKIASSGASVEFIDLRFVNSPYYR